MASSLNITILGLSITSSWGNGHATTYRHLVDALTDRGHQVVFLERARPWYENSRDLAETTSAQVHLYESIEELQQRFATEVQTADLVIVGSYVPEGVAVGSWVTQCARGITAFYDIDTPVTLAQLSQGNEEYQSRALVPRYDMYLSFAAGPTLDILENQYGSPMARPLFCSVDPSQYFPIDVHKEWELGYLGTYSTDRQPTLEKLLLEPARRHGGKRFAVGGPQYPQEIQWPANVQRYEHVPPAEHARFYNRQRFTLNVTRSDMIRAGYSPSVRLFEAAACGVPIISDTWPGLDRFFEIGKEILVASSPDEVSFYLEKLGEDECLAIGRRARRKVLQNHTAEHRAVDLEGYVDEVARNQRRRNSVLGQTT